MNYPKPRPTNASADKAEHKRYKVGTLKSSLFST